MSNKDIFNLKKIKHSRKIDTLESSKLYISHINKFISQDRFQNYLSFFENL